MIFLLVSPWLIGLFVVVSVLASITHKISGSYQKVPMTFVVMVGVSLWFGSEPYGEPFPGALTLIVWMATALQAVMAAVAYWVKDVRLT